MPRAESAQRSSGTGGFAFIGESALPVVQDLNTEAGPRFFRFGRRQTLAGVEVVSMRVHDGDDASCLNLNRAQTPRLLGVNAGVAESARPSPSPQLADASCAAPALVAAGEASGDEIPAIGDEATITWALAQKNRRHRRLYRRARAGPSRCASSARWPIPSCKAAC